MSDRKPGAGSPDARALDAVVAEAKEHLVPKAELDWARLESRLMDAVESSMPDHDLEASGVRPSRPELGSARPRGGALRIAVRTGMVAFAAAAAIGLLVRKDRDVVVDGAKVAEAAPASSLRATEGDGEVRINKVLVTAKDSPGYVIRHRDVVDVVGARAVFEQVRKVTWLIEGQSEGEPGASGSARNARAHVKAAGDPLVLGLEEGAIEAQVAPVPVGEAFAVDVATDHGVVRVAVHGTHLRVTRAGNHVTVDLTEGVVSIGVPPRTGVTYGTLVTAPAHVELDATDLRTLRVEHAPERVRAAIPLSTHEPTALRAPSLPPASPGVVPRVDSSAVVPPAPAAAQPPSRVAAAPPAHPAAKPEAAKVKVPPREVIAAAVRDCAATHGHMNDGQVNVTVTSDLHLRVSAAGEVETAQFSPPLLPDIQSCAAAVIYRTKLEETGLVTIPIEFSY